MEKLKQKEHDFSAKLRQNSVIDNLKQYVTWQRDLRRSGSDSGIPLKAPISINLDLTSACNFACPHCVDSGIINIGQQLDLDTMAGSIDTLKKNGLLSVILIGGGEPTIHRDFEEIVRLSKARGLQVGIATNGSRLDKVANIAGELEKGDWLRLSLDAGTEDTFYKSHRPKRKVTLEKILHDARDIKERFPDISLGYSFVIVWEGITINGNDLCPNIGEMSLAASLARQNLFDYVSYKPCLLRLEGSKKESLFAKPDIERENMVINSIRQGLEQAKDVAADDVKILESVNLRAMMERKVHELKVQPKTCHSQFFRSVLTPTGVYHCPAFRGIEKAKVAAADGYTDMGSFNETLAETGRSIQTFDSEQECNVVACFYHHVNWWIENLIESGTDVDTLQMVEDNNFFL